MRVVKKIFFTGIAWGLLVLSLICFAGAITDTFNGGVPDGKDHGFTNMLWLIGGFATACGSLVSFIYNASLTWKKNTDSL